jgi:chromosome segregation ATPase
MDQSLSKFSQHENTQDLELLLLKLEKAWATSELQCKQLEISKNEAEESVKQWKAKCEDLESENEELSQRVDTLTSDFALLEELRRQQVELLKQKFHIDLVEMRDNQDAVIQSQTLEMDQLTKNNVTLSREVRSLRQRTEDLQNEVDTCNENMKSIYEELRQREEQIPKITAVGLRLIDLLRQAKQELTELRKVNEELEADNADLRQQCEMLTVTLSSTQAKLDTLQDDHDDLRKCYQEASAERNRLEQVEHKLIRVELDYREAVSDRDKAIIDLTTLKQHYDLLVASMRDDEIRQQSEIEALRTEYATLSQQRASEQARLSKEASASKADRDIAIDKYRRSNSEKKDVLKFVDLLKKTVGDLKQQLGKTDGARVQALKELKTMTRGYLQLRERMESTGKSDDWSPTEASELSSNDPVDSFDNIDPVTADKNLTSVGLDFKAEHREKPSY